MAHRALTAGRPAAGQAAARQAAGRRPAVPAGGGRAVSESAVKLKTISNYGR